MAKPKLDGRVIIVTGVGSGLGRAMGLALSAAGANVIGADRDEAGARETAQKATSGGGHFTPVTCDVRSVDECRKVVDTAVGKGALYGLVNCAGLGMSVMSENYYADPVHFWKADPDRWQLVMDVNVRGPFLMAREVAPHLIAAKRGRIVNVTTSFNTMIRGANMPYGQSKAALEAASSSWAEDLKSSGVTVNILVPGGAADTKLVPQNSPYDRTQLIRPEIMMEPICWLMSDEADGITGQRFVAQLWDGTVSGREAARKAGAPAAWPALAQEAAAAGQPMPKGGFKV